MKKQTTSVLIALLTAALLTAGCSRPSERPSAVDKKIAANLFEMSNAAEITNEKTKSVYFTGSEKDLGKLDPSLKQVKMEGAVQSVFSRVKSPAAKASLDEQLKTGVVAIVVLKDQIKIMKVVPEVNLSVSYDVCSMAYMKKLKALSRATDVKAQADVLRELQSLKLQSPGDLGEKFGMVEIAAIKVAKFGALDNDRTDYGEKKSILNVQERPFEFSTHLVLGDEIAGAADGEDSSANLK